MEKTTKPRPKTSKPNLKQEKLELNEGRQPAPDDFGKPRSARLQRDDCIRSPINGEFVSSSVAPGDIVFPGQVLGRINSHSRLIEVSLNEEDYRRNEGRTLASRSQSFFLWKPSIRRPKSIGFRIPRRSRKPVVRKLYLKLNSDRRTANRRSRTCGNHQKSTQADPGDHPAQILGRQVPYFCRKATV